MNHYFHKDINIEGHTNGEYWKYENRDWVVITPDGHFGGLSNHKVLEHEDGTITVSPSILLTYPGNGKLSTFRYHGYLRHGKWETLRDSTNYDEIMKGTTDDTE